MNFKQLIFTGLMAFSSLAQAAMVTAEHSNENPLFIKWDNMNQYDYVMAPTADSPMKYAFYGVTYDDTLSEFAVAGWSGGFDELTLSNYSNNPRRFGWTGNGFEDYSRFKGMQLVVTPCLDEITSYTVIYERNPVSEQDLPEPATLSMLGLSLAGLMAFRKKKRS